MVLSTRFPFSVSPAVLSLRSPSVCVLLLGCLLLGTGCGRLRHHKQQETVYVWTRHMYLRDRVAVVSNHVGEVTNGERLEVLEHNRRFLRVKTEKNVIGWIPERAVIDGKTYGAFEQLAAAHKDDPVVATGTLRDDVYEHVAPGRDEDRFYLLPGDEKVQMLVRASVPKGGSLGRPAQPKRGEPKAQGPAKPDADDLPPTPGEPETEALPMEDWWLVRDSQGRVGWILGNRADVDVPLNVAQYAEGQKIVGAYVIARVHDDQATDVPDHEVAEYVTALAPPKSGLPYDFDQIRVFTWSLKHHRYETAFRIHPIQGYLPVKISSEQTDKGTEPVFSFQIAGSPDVAINPETGIAKPAQERTISYALRDTLVKRVGPDMAPIPLLREPGEKKAEKRRRK